MESCSRRQARASFAPGPAFQNAADTRSAGAIRRAEALAVVQEHVTAIVPPIMARALEILEEHQWSRDLAACAAGHVPGERGGAENVHRGNATARIRVADSWEEPRPVVSSLHGMRSRPSGCIKRNDTRKYVEDDVLAWVVIGMVFGGVTLALWAILLWQSMHG